MQPRRHPHGTRSWTGLRHGGTFKAAQGRTSREGGDRHRFAGSSPARKGGLSGSDGNRAEAAESGTAGEGIPQSTSGGILGEPRGNVHGHYKNSNERVE